MYVCRLKLGEGGREKVGGGGREQGDKFLYCAFLM